MAVEAVDQKYPHLRCVAHIKRIEEDGKLFIEFDGWCENRIVLCDSVLMLEIGQLSTASRLHSVKLMWHPLALAVL